MKDRGKKNFIRDMFKAQNQYVYYEIEISTNFHLLKAEWGALKKDDAFANLLWIKLASENELNFP